MDAFDLILFGKLRAADSSARHVSQQQSDYITASNAIKAGQGYMGSFEFKFEGRGR